MRGRRHPTNGSYVYLLLLCRRNTSIHALGWWSDCSQLGLELGLAKYQRKSRKYFKNLATLMDITGHYPATTIISGESKWDIVTHCWTTAVVIIGYIRLGLSFKLPPVGVIVVDLGLRGGF